MAELVAYLRRTCDVVIFTAPSLAGAETRALAALSDAVLVVMREELGGARRGRTSGLGQKPSRTGSGARFNALAVLEISLLQFRV